jgi:hypothetical protein
VTVSSTAESAQARYVTNCSKPTFQFDSRRFERAVRNAANEVVQARADDLQKLADLLSSTHKGRPLDEVKACWSLAGGRSPATEHHRSGADHLGHSDQRGAEDSGSACIHPILTAV